MNKFRKYILMLTIRLVLSLLIERLTTKTVIGYAEAAAELEGGKFAKRGDIYRKVRDSEPSLSQTGIEAVVGLSMYYVEELK